MIRDIFGFLFYFSQAWNRNDCIIWNHADVCHLFPPVSLFTNQTYCCLRLFHLPPPRLSPLPTLRTLLFSLPSAFLPPSELLGVESYRRQTMSKCCFSRLCFDIASLRPLSGTFNWETMLRTHVLGPCYQLWSLLEVTGMNHVGGSVFNLHAVLSEALNSSTLFTIWRCVVRSFAS